MCLFKAFCPFWAFHYFISWPSWECATKSSHPTMQIPKCIMSIQTILNKNCLQLTDGMQVLSQNMGKANEDFVLQAMCRWASSAQCGNQILLKLTANPSGRLCNVMVNAISRPNLMSSPVLSRSVCLLANSIHLSLIPILSEYAYLNQVPDILALVQQTTAYPVLIRYWL